MYTLKQPLYFCNECKKVVNHLDDLLFVDEFSHKGFCSEECIEDFYFPLIKHFEIVEHSLRARLNLLSETGLIENIDQQLVEAVLTSPAEVYRQANELQENFYYFIKHYPDFSAVVIASVYRKEASFVFLSTLTRSQSLLREFRHGELVTDWFNESGLGSDEEEMAKASQYDNVNDFEESGTVDPEESDDEAFAFMQLLESKKSKILADIIVNSKDSDIPFEDYPGYEYCFQETLDQPDEVFERKDKDGDVIFTYIKSFENFFYIVICLKRTTDENTVNVYPILAVPTNDIKMCQEFRGGTRLSGPLTN